MTTTNVYEDWNLNELLNQNMPIRNKKKVKAKRVVKIVDAEMNNSEYALVGTTAPSPEIVKENRDRHEQEMKTEQNQDLESVKKELENQKKDNQKLSNDHRREVLTSIFSEVPNKETLDALIQRHMSTPIPTEMYIELAKDLKQHASIPKQSTSKKALYGSSNATVFTLEGNSSNKVYKSKSLTSMLSSGGNN